MLAEVYLELLGGREPGLVLAQKTQAVKEVQSETITLTERVFREARLFEVSDEEKQQHIEFVKGIKNNLWGIVPDESK